MDNIFIIFNFEVVFFFRFFKLLLGGKRCVYIVEFLIVVMYMKVCFS